MKNRLLGSFTTFSRIPDLILALFPLSYKKSSLEKKYKSSSHPPIFYSFPKLTGSDEIVAISVDPYLSIIC